MMLANGLGELMRVQSTSSARIVDLFCGSASVAWFASQEFDRPVLAVDLQEYAVVLAGAVIERGQGIDADGAPEDWLNAVIRRRRQDAVWSNATALDATAGSTATWSRRARELCQVVDGGLMWNAYGGHYFSPTQAVTFDAMLDVLPRQGHARAVCLAATVIAASKCVAAPGHTAQPFKATATAGRFMRAGLLTSYARCTRSASVRQEWAMRTTWRRRLKSMTWCSLIRRIVAFITVDSTTCSRRLRADSAAT